MGPTRVWGVARRIFADLNATHIGSERSGSQSNGETGVERQRVLSICIGGPICRFAPNSEAERRAASCHPLRAWSLGRRGFVSRHVNPILGPGHLSSHARPGLSSNRLAAINPWIRCRPARSAIAMATGLFCPTIYRILAEDCDASSGFSDGGSVGKVVCGTGPVYAPDERPNFPSETSGRTHELPRFRFTIRTMMILVLISAVILTLCGLVREPLIRF